jgi:hypothetical protein
VRAALSAAQAQAVGHTLTTGKSDEMTTTTALADNTTFANESGAPEPTSKFATMKVKKKGKPKLTPKEKKERSVSVFRLGVNTELLDADPVVYN